MVLAAAVVLDYATTRRFNHSARGIIQHQARGSQEEASAAGGRAQGESNEGSNTIQGRAAAPRAGGAAVR